MADLSGYTAMTEIHGDGAAVAMITKYVEMGRNSLSGESVLMERTGDQLFFISDKADDLAKTAIELKRKTEKEPNFLGIHCGLHYGPTIEQDGNFYGSVVNVTARIAGSAKDNMILCSKEFVNALSHPDEFRIVPQGINSFKNVLESVEVFELLPAIEKKIRKVYVDPVCHIRLNGTEAHISLVEDEIEYFFCSEECKKLYQEHEFEGAI